jgi:hypothetical protein
MMERRDFLRRSCLPLLPVSGSVIAGHPAQQTLLNSPEAETRSAADAFNYRVVTVGKRAHRIISSCWPASRTRGAIAVDTDAGDLMAANSHCRFHYNARGKFGQEKLYLDCRKLFQGAHVGLQFIDLDSEAGTSRPDICNAVNAAAHGEDVYLMCNICFGRHSLEDYEERKEFSGFRELSAVPRLFFQLYGEYPHYPQYLFHLLETMLVRMPLEENPLVCVDLMDIKACLARSGRSIAIRRTGQNSNDLLANLERIRMTPAIYMLMRANQAIAYISMPESGELSDVYKVVDWLQIRLGVRSDQEAKTLFVFGANCNNPLGEYSVTLLATGI